MDNLKNELLNQVILEATGHLSAIEPDLVLLESVKGTSNSTEIVNRLFRAIHSIKGSFGFFDFAHITRLTHVIESALMLARDGKQEITAEFVDTLLKGVDKVGDLVEDVQHSETISIDSELALFEPFLEKRKGKLISDTEAIPKQRHEHSEGLTGKAIPEQATDTKPGPETDKEIASEQKNGNIESLRVRVPLLNKLMDLAGELVLARNQIINKMNQKAWGVLPDGGKSLKKFDTFTTDLLDSVLEVVKKSNRVPLEDNNLRYMLKELLEVEVGKMKSDFGRMLSEPISHTPAVKAVLHQIDLVTSDIQESIMCTRLQTMRGVFSRLPRIVRDLSKKLNKLIKVQISGDDVELDKSLLEALSDPLTHIIRNSGDHGIESPEEREQAGKPAEGQITVKALHQGDLVIIEISDDGKGIDTKTVREQAIKKGLLAPEDARPITESQLHELIFHAGFSTAREVTGTSGRGVGMDIVKNNIGKLGGTVDIHSVVGKGTTIRLKIPLTMTIIPSILVVSGCRRFALPQAGLEDLLRIRASEVSQRVEMLGDSPVIRRRGRLLPLVRLSDVLGLKRTFINPFRNETGVDRRKRLVDRRSKPKSSDREVVEVQKNVDQDSPVGPENRRVTIKDRRGSSKSAMQIVVLSLEETYYGLIVEEVIDIEETVVKPLSSYLKKSKCYMGATILSDGRVSMILDPLGVANIANLKFTEIDQSISKSITPFETLRPEQETLLFKNDTPEQFAVNIQSISRIEKVDIADIEKTGEKEFIHYKGSSLRIARIHDFLPVSKPKQIECNFVFVLIPKYVSPLVGIVATEMLDIVPVDRLNRETLTGSGVLATSIIKNKRTLFIDIFTLAQAAEPQLFPDIYSPVLKGLRVLLTGKDDYYQIVVHRYLEEAGMKVTREESGVSALNRLEKHGPYDIILTDLEMHDLGAQELIRKVNSTFALSSIPVFILLRQISQKIVFQIEQTGADAYALKLDRDKVLQGIITLINPPSPKKSPGVDDVIQSHLNASGERTNEN